VPGNSHDSGWLHRRRWANRGPSPLISMVENTGTCNRHLLRCRHRLRSQQNRASSQAQFRSHSTVPLLGLRRVIWAQTNRASTGDQQHNGCSGTLGVKKAVPPISVTGKTSMIGMCAAHLLSKTFNTHILASVARGWRSVMQRQKTLFTSSETKSEQKTIDCRL